MTGSSTAYTSYAYNAANQLCWRSNTNVASPSCTSTPAGATSFTYDADGNQLTGDVAMTYDDKGRLATLGGASVTHLSPTNWELTAVGSTSFRNTILGVNYINAAGNINKIQRTPETGAAVSQVRDSAKRWYVTDQIGSTIALVDSAGTVQRTYAYDVDGNDTTTGTGPATQIKFAGGHDVGSGLYHFGKRYYQPSTARWTQQDSLLQPSDLGQANRYSYGASDPLNNTDPEGEAVVTGPQCDLTRFRNTPSCKEYTKRRNACVTGAATGIVLKSPGGASIGCAIGVATGKPLVKIVYDTFD